MAKRFVLLLHCLAAGCTAPDEMEPQQVSTVLAREQQAISVATLQSPTLDGRTLGASGAGAFDFSAVQPLTLYDFIKSGGTSSHSRSVGDLATESWTTGGVVSNDVSSIFVPPGREATVCTSAWYRGTCRRFTANEPGYVWALSDFGLDQDVESVEYRPLGGLDWSDADTLGSHPNHRNNELSQNIQGVAHSAGHWFISKQTRVFRIPIGTNLNDASFAFPELALSEIPGHCDHIGDVDFYSGELFLPLEGCEGDDREGDDRIAVYRIADDGSFVFVRQLLLGNQTHAPWVAINPINGLMYSSDFDEPGDTIVRAYDRNFTSGTLIDGQKFHVVLPRHFGGVQGGVFDDRGNLYLTENGDPGAGIYAFRIAGGYGTSTRFIGPDGFKPNFPYYQEVEGIDWWDLSEVATAIPGIDTGPGAASLHWLLLDNDLSGDEFWFKHVRLH